MEAVGMNGNAPHSLADPIRATNDEGTIVEIISGEIVSRVNPRGVHEELIARIHDSLSQHADAQDLGAVFRLPWPVELSKFDLVRPDVYFVAWKDGVLDVDGVRGVPELIVEVVSADTRDRDFGEKKRLYAWSGVFEYWIVDPVAGTFQAFCKGKSGYDPIPIPGSTLSSVFLTGYELDLDWLFEGTD
jgi:Uma2 family endonuclease